MSGMMDMNALRELQVCPGNIEGLYSAVIEHSDLTLSDCQTARDLINSAGLFNDITAHGLLAALFQHIADGSPCMDMDPANWKRMFWLVEAMGEDSSRLQEIADVFLKKGLLVESADKKLDIIPRVPLIIQPNKDKKRRFIYFQKFYTAEEKVRSRLESFLNVRGIAPFDGCPDDKIQSALKDVCGLMGKPGLDPLQLAAVVSCLYKNFSVISGGPGTGKTTTAAAVLRTLVRLGLKPEKILLSAPTGRAAQRLKESILEQLNPEKKELGPGDHDLRKSLESKTIHRALNFSPFHSRFFYSQSRRLPYDVILVDEVSMVDIFIMGSLLEAVKDGARVIFMGDKDQLPSVDAGAVLEDLVPEDYTPIFTSELKKNYETAATACLHKEAVTLDTGGDPDNSLRDRVVILKTSFRSNEKILDFANRVNHFKQGMNLAENLPVLKGQNIDWPGAGNQSGRELCLLDEKTDIAGWRSQLEDWALKHFDLDSKSRFRQLLKKFPGESRVKKIEILDEVFKTVNNAQVLTLVHAGLEGGRWINKTLGRFIRDRLDSSRRDEAVFNGASIIITQNDYRNNLFNGDTGVIIKHDSDYRAWFSCEGEYRQFPVKSLQEWAPGWAITVHKSQGSEYKHVLLVLPADENHRMLTREILYTGVTRAKETVVIRGTGASLNKGGEDRISRESGIELW